MEIDLITDKRAVMDEVAQTTAYTGAKMETGQAAALERISTVDEDSGQLERFWDESRSDLSQELIGLVCDERMDGERYVLGLNVTAAFDEKLLPSMQISLQSYFVHSIVAKWYIYTNKGEAGAYADKAQSLLDDVHRKALYKKKPQRPRY